MLCLTAIIIARFAQKRASMVVCFLHALLFCVLLFSLFFTTNSPFIQFAMENAFGKEYYSIRLVLLTPCLWIWSANIAICIAEIIMLLIVTVGVVIYVAKKLSIKNKPFHLESETEPVIPPVQFFANGHKLFLEYCHLLN